MTFHPRVYVCSDTMFKAYEVIVDLTEKTTIKCVITRDELESLKAQVDLIIATEENLKQYME